MTNIKKHLGSNIRHFRVLNGISQAKLAEMVNMATNYLGLIENGRKFPSANMVERIASALGLDSIDLFTLPPIEFNWKEGILHKIRTLIDIEIQSIRIKEN